VGCEPEELRDRTKAFALRGIRLYRSLPTSADAQVLGKQLLRSATSVAANYRAACRARSRAEWIAKLGLVVEEADESLFWLQLMVDCDLIRPANLESISRGSTVVNSDFYCVTKNGEKEEVTSF